MRRRPPRSTQSRSSAASDVYKRQGVAHRVGGRVGVGDRRVDDARSFVGDGGDVVAVHPAAALADVGDLELQAARHELLEAARGEVRGAAGADELTPVAVSYTHL